MGFSRQEYWRGLPFPPPGDFDGPEPPVQGGREPLRGWGCDLCPEGAGPCACAHPRVRCAPPTGCARSLDQDTAPPRGASRSGVLTSAFPSPGHQGRPLVALRNPGRHPIGGNLEQNLCHRSLGSDSTTPWTVARQTPLSKGFFSAVASKSFQEFIKGGKKGRTKGSAILY